MFLFVHEIFYLTYLPVGTGFACEYPQPVGLLLADSGDLWE